MHYAISYQAEHNDFLICTSRRKSLKHKLICVRQGLVLVKLGKHEFAVEPNQYFWLPFDTLVSITYTPNTLVDTIELSSRVSLRLPKQAGFIKSNELMTALLNRLRDVPATRDKQIDLLTVLQQELVDLCPALKEGKLSQQIAQWKYDGESSLSSELQLVLRVREANKQMQSGKKRPVVVEALFDGNDSLFTGLEKAILGR
ncbi:hypothetical protein VIOR3934_00080 [Vibrio orientalis CIP 102891 = ATCC 33934]|uniref:AraC family transcriptional regulator n=1 Tax=Vibrio orientalis CIP 102891 = ATCC 33934 TaxID=675816 RepID=C9QHK8_VIBOR|nr:hypothetical protein [Vibrio orientalis]EEX93739.1 hypothetical protein VIA_000896 [Vibrio orientalis CIP 102891 = ATCC 33934]EGU50747.1 hypothetical protein VIOR3934_00080 [Vibrio orientalis CIP 102891 = ATCC 33934]